MGRCSINWMNPDVQKAIDDYICRRIPTQAKLRQEISGHLQQHISEQALSIYLKRNGYLSFARKQSPNSSVHLKQNNHSINSSPGGDESTPTTHHQKQQQQQAAVLPSSTIASISSVLPHPLSSAEHFYATQQPLFLNGVNSSTGGGGGCGDSPSAAASSSTAVIVDPIPTSVNFIHVSSPAFTNVLDMTSSSGGGNNNGGGVRSSGSCGDGGNNVAAIAAAQMAAANQAMNMRNDSNAGTAATSSNLQRYILDPQQQLHRAMDAQQQQHNLIQQHLLGGGGNQWQNAQQQNAGGHPQQQDGSQQSSATDNSEGGIASGNGGGKGRSKNKRAPNSSQPIDWNDTVVQNAIQNYFSRKIKLQTELRQVIMKRLNRNISENSLRLHLKKLKNSVASTSNLTSSPQHALSAGHSSQQSAATTVILNDAFRLKNPIDNLTSEQFGGLSMATAGLYPTSGNAAAMHPKDLTYYIYNNFAANIPVSTTCSNANQMLNSNLVSAESFNFSDLGSGSSGSGAGGGSSSGGGKSLMATPVTMVKTINDQLQSSMLNGSGSTNDGGDETKPAVRRRINWGNEEVQKAIQQFYDREFLTQAKLRSRIEEILGQAVSEQALSIYLKRKKSRNQSSDEVLLMNLNNCGEENMS